VKTNAEITAKHREYLLPSQMMYYKEPVAFERGEGHFLWDVEGKQYLDFFGGIVTVSVGHCNPEITEKVVAQYKTLQHTSTLFPNRQIVSLAEKLAAITPGRLQQSYFTNSGSEANETAIMLAKAYTGRNQVVALKHSYSGGTALTRSLCGTGTWRIGEPTQQVVHAASAYCYRCPFEKKFPTCEMQCAQDLKHTIETTTNGEIAAFIAEPIQGVGGFITPPKEYFKEVYKIARDHGGVVIADEVQTAWGRTGGKWFGIEQWDVEPDMITSAKGMANGLPVGWTIATPELAGAIKKGIHLSTFGGNPVTSTGALATIEFIEKNQLLDNATTTGAYLRNKLEGLMEKHMAIGEVRGMGLMQAMEFVKDRKTKEPAPQLTQSIIEAMREEGLLMGKGGLHGNVIRMSPPLTIGKTEVDDAIERLDRALTKASKAL
jgi:4-aminobutyrate aminotransferase